MFCSLGVSLIVNSLKLRSPYDDLLASEASRLGDCEYGMTQGNPRSISNLRKSPQKDLRSPYVPLLEGSSSKGGKLESMLEDEGPMVCGMSLSHGFFGAALVPKGLTD